MEYSEKYTADDLHEMFANGVDNESLANWDTANMAQQLSELAPDMEDAAKVAEVIKANAERNLSWQ